MTRPVLPETKPNVPASTSRLRWLEICLVLLVAFGGSVLRSLYILENGSSASSQMTNAAWGIGILHELTALLLLVYVLSRRSLRLRDLGLRWSLRDVGAGLLVTGASYAAYWLCSTAISLVHYQLYGFWANAPGGRGFLQHPTAAAIPFYLLNPFFEELIVRAYLMSEVTDLTGSSTLAVVLSVAAQFSYHLYFGWAEAISLSFAFLIFALHYALSGRALPIIIAHLLLDLNALVRHW